MVVHELSVGAFADGGHACCFYDSDREQQMLITRFVRDSLESGHRVIGIADAASTRRILDALLAEPPASAAAASGQFRVLGSDQTYVADGVFDCGAMLARWSEETARALEDGYAGLRVTGDVTWYTRDLPGVRRLVDYERALDDALAGTRASALCQYDRRRLDDALLAEAVAIHRHTPAAPRAIAPETFRVLGDGPNAFRLVGELDLAAAGVLDDTLSVATADGADRLALDLADLRFIDAAGVSALCRPAIDGRATLELRRPPSVVQRVLSILHADRLPAVHIDHSEGR